MNPASTAVVPQRIDSNQQPQANADYDITRTIRLSREELRKQRLHEMADIFMNALEVRA